MNSADQTSVKVGEHEFQFVAPDQLWFFLRGEFDEFHVEPYLNFVFAQADSSNRLFYCAFELHEFTNVTPGARRLTTKISRPYPFAGVAIVSAKFSIRTVAGMILTAGRLLAPNAYKFPIKFVDTADEAKVWFDELRRARS